METFSALLAFCAENSPSPGEFSAQRPVTRSFDIFFDLHLNKQLSKQSRGWWFETLSGSLRRQCNDFPLFFQEPPEPDTQVSRTQADSDVENMAATNTADDTKTKVGAHSNESGIVTFHQNDDISVSVLNAGIYALCKTMYRWLSDRLWYLQHKCDGDTTTLVKC